MREGSERKLPDPPRRQPQDAKQSFALSGAPRRRFHVLFKVPTAASEVNLIDLANFLRRPTLTWKLWCYFAALSLVPLVSILFILQSAAERGLQQQVLMRIDAIADRKAAELESLFAAKIADVRVLATTPRVIAAVEQLVQRDSSAGGGKAMDAAEEQSLRDLLSVHIGAHQYANVFIASPAGDELFTFAGHSELGTNYLAGAFPLAELCACF